jgi:acetyl esterase/lipase
MNRYSSLFILVIGMMLSFVPALQAIDLPPELPLWETPPKDYVVETDVKEQVRSNQAGPGSPSGSNRVFSAISLPTYSIHRPKNPNGVGLVICPGGGYTEVWLDREGHDLAIWLKDQGVTSLVLKYRTYLTPKYKSENTWPSYLRAVQADGEQAIRVLRKNAFDLGLRPNKIGICGFSAGGHLALTCSLYPTPKPQDTGVSAMPDFAGLFYPGIPENVDQAIKKRMMPESATADICPMFIMNARDDQLTPAAKCLDFYALLLKAGVNAELHIFGKGSHGFDMGRGRGKSVTLWPTRFVAWLYDTNIIIQD